MPLLIELVVNDQGGGVMEWNEEEISPTLRREMKHHEPIIVAKCIGNGQADQLYEQDTTGALNCMHDQQIVMIGVDGYNQTITGDVTQSLCATRMDAHHMPLVLESTNTNARIRDDGICDTLTSRMGMGRNNTPVLIDSPLVYDCRGNGDGNVSCTITGGGIKLLFLITPIL